MSNCDISRDRSWSTDGVDPTSALHEWADLVSNEIAEMGVEAPTSAPFGASWRRYGLGPLDLNFLATRPQRVTRSRAMVARNRAPFFELLYPRGRRIIVDHGGMSSEIPQGSFVLLHNQLAYTLQFPEGSDCLTAHIPEHWLLSWVAHPRAHVGKPLGSGPWTRPLKGILTAIADGGLGTAGLPRAVLSDQIGASIAMLIGDPANPDRATDLIARIKAAIADQHAKIGLTPLDIAAPLGISVRHLHRMLAVDGTSFGRVLNENRISRARQIADSATAQGLSIGELAWRVGYTDQGHFARVFRALVGTTPTAYRRSRSM